MAGTAYLDYAATTPVCPEARAAMVPLLDGMFGNPSGGHAVARAAKQALEEARETVGELLGALPGEVVFTGGGTEADNLAVKGAARIAGAGDVVTSAFEHKGVLAPAARLHREGFRHVLAPITSAGIVDLDALADLLSSATVVVSVMLVNNEVGTVQPLDAVVELVRRRSPRAVVHTDAVQGVPWVDVAAATAGVDLVSVSAHKFGGPKGIGALLVRGGVPLEPLIEGGGQERGLRSGTNDVAGAAGMAAALEVTVQTRPATVARVAALRDRLVDGLRATVPDLAVNGDPAAKIAGNCHVTVPGIEAEALLVLLDRAGIMAAAGSSCSSGAAEPSHVLEAMGCSREHALASVRLSLGAPSTAADIEHVLHAFPEAVAQLRQAGRAA